MREEMMKHAARKVSYESTSNLKKKTQTLSSATVAYTLINLLQTSGIDACIRSRHQAQIDKS